ncbi:FISUMP domain-containing protein [uncultured Fibrobacter sp.]|uniref:FISUMP domain-containing protein n=1 Tax=uncultured Fibrobacter sp. TaxID=261512 RepID=UPI0025DFC09D|nr:FISUMP domain-containing protein [uncultured Fibrobacter sp.]
MREKLKDKAIMKKTFKSIIFAALLVGFFSACSDDASSASEEPVDTFDASVVCPADGVNGYGEPNRGTFTDARDGQVYKYTTIGNQVWMAENLKFDAPYSVCYDKIDGFCDTFGRFYSLHVNGEFFDVFDQELLDTICPAGWRVPTMDEWQILYDNMGGEGKAGRRLTSASDFGEGYTPGSDDCGFNSLPAGSWHLNGNLGANVFFSAVYWTSTAESLNATYVCIVDPTRVAFWINEPKMTIRCVKN